MSDTERSSPETDRTLLDLLQQMRKTEMKEGDAAERRTVFEWWEKAFGQKVRQWRKARDWSQEYLAEQLNLHGFDIHQTTVAKIERGARPLRVSEAVALAAVFGMPALSVFYGPGPEQEPMSEQKMRELMEKLEEGARHAQEQLESAAKHVAYYEAQRASMADAINRAALEADRDDDTSEA
ncbi:helix-turn-helix transcriptional regulator [Rhodococcus sp. 7Tela_A2]|uniref:helix-turn-helix domain-containing protein n=1 Tax=Rhodococcus sp. 7Tela_A2 TaxID=3093744 RepID=UPI003BB63EDB